MKSSKSRIAGLVAIGGSLSLIGAVAVDEFASASEKSGEFRVNQLGDTFGSSLNADSIAEEPDLIEAIGLKGIQGYVKKSDLYGTPPSSPEQAAAIRAIERIIPVYQSDGKTVVDTFRIDAIAPRERAADGESLPTGPIATVVAGDENGQLAGRITIDPTNLEKSLDVAPDFVAVWNRDGSEIAGYVAKTALVGGMDGAPVLSVDGIRVGTWFDGKGFIGIDEDPTLVENSGMVVAG